MRAKSLLLLFMFVLVAGCDAPVRVGIHEARAAGVTAPAGGQRLVFASASDSPVPGQQAVSHGQPPPQPNRPPPNRPASSAAMGPQVVVPPVPQPHGPDDLVGLKLQHDGAGAARPVTFGEIFLSGQLPRGSGLAARAEGRAIPAQLDVKTTNPDGSVRFGIVTLTVAAPADVMLVRHPAEAAAPVDLAAMLGNDDLAVDLVLHGAGADEQHHFVAATLLADALRAGKASYWLRGPLATEARVDVPVAGSLHLTFDIRGYADGSSLTDVQFNNDIAMQPVGGTVHYDATISQHGKPVFHQAAIEQFQYQTWHHEVWSNSDPDVNVVHDAAIMERAGAVLGYDLTTGVAESVLTDEQRSLAKPGFTDILGSAGIVKYMPMSGARADLAPLPNWDAIWLVTQNTIAARYALVQADAAGSVPWHLFDPASRSYATTDTWPKLWTDGRGGQGGTTGLTQQGDPKSGWSPDFSHQPGLSYLAYLQTGLRYYLDQLNAQATWTVLGIWPAVRQDGRGIVATERIQLRGAAWSLRELVEAAYINPDDGPLKAYFTRLVGNNIDYLQTEAKTAHEGEIYGWFRAIYGYQKGAMAPWQQDYMASTITLAAEQGVPGAKELLTWQAHFLAGRFLAGDKGLAPYDGAAFNMLMWDTSEDQPFQTWRELGDKIVANHWTGGGSAWPGEINVMYVAARAVLGGIVTVTDLPEARQALTWLNAHPPAGSEGTLRVDPGWNIIPIKQ